MQHIEENISVTPLSGDEYKVDKRLERRFKREERIRSRVWELDFIRGFCIILMIFDHLMFDLGYLFGDIWYSATLDPVYNDIATTARLYWNWDVRLVVQNIVLVCFFSICGISCTFSRNNAKRGSLLFVIALLLTAVTSAIGEPILFGVLHMLAISILVVALIRAITRKRPKATSIVAICMAVLAIVAEIVLQNVDVPKNNNLSFISEAFVDNRYTSMDYFPLLPNMAVVLIGVAIAPLLYPTKRTLFARLDTQFRWYRPVNYFGRHAIEWYVLHQVIWGLALGLYTIIAIPNGWELIVANFF